MRLLPVSAMASMPGNGAAGGNGGANAIELGVRNSPAAAPRPPDISANVPFG